MLPWPTERTESDIATGRSRTIALALQTISTVSSFCRRLSMALMSRIHQNYRFILGFNTSLIAGGILGLLGPASSALLHNLSTMAVSHNFEGTEMLGSIAKLLFFLILWFVVGIYLIPVLLKKCRKLMSEETLLIVSLGLCFGMVVLAAHTGFSAAFGAFIMGSILAENGRGGKY